ncbi:unnamed protein product [Linum trigynum]|uniref:Uncharacterized protein n=1 Tax=Linum trigynum TaxID=586398 RepID=A0AAV2CHB1_9ROSI
MVTLVDETGVDELMAALKELMADLAHAERRRQEDKEEILRAIAKLKKYLEVTQERQQRIEATMGLEFEVVTKDVPVAIRDGAAELELGTTATEASGSVMAAVDLGKETLGACGSSSL